MHPGLRMYKLKQLLLRSDYRLIGFSDTITRLLPSFSLFFYEL